MNINILLFDKFQTLDIFGPIEILSRVEDYEIHYYSQNGGTIVNAQNAKIITEPFACADKNGILVIPGGRGTRPLVNDAAFLEMLRSAAQQAEYCLSICTGSALLGKCGVLDGRKATSNKKALDWVKSEGNQVKWVDKARWVVDGKFYTSSGVSAGIDMALGFVCDRFGRDKAEKIAAAAEYIWNDDSENDIFASINID